MSLLSRLFGSGSRDEGPEAAGSAETYQGFTITPTPIKDSGGYRVSARIEKVVDGETRTHTLIRADTIGELDTAATISLAKARMLIDEQGETIFE